MRGVLISALCAVLLGACTPLVPIKSFNSENERLHATIDYKIGIREARRANLLAASDPG